MPTAVTGGIAQIEWDASDPPDDWRSVIDRWQRIDVLRSSAAILAFAFFVAGAAVG